ncbi:ABC transporter permease [Rhodoplanes roseus]|uniref:ABC transporter permease n=1 Tax=Rhodoplanes roseus TaxID=29409 RepID=A0A327L346_9BRAD|nr:ABC transporter permease subunit [Rhodoplanes roseus]RAI43912.1 ABC transporter permease [Rhodoplanes roseus]
MSTIVDDRTGVGLAEFTDEDSAPRVGLRWRSALPPLAWLVLAGITTWWPSPQEWPRTEEFVALASTVAAVLALLAVLGPWLGVFGARVRHAEPWLIALAVIATVWELVTAKLAWLPVPFFMPPQAILEVYLDEGGKLAECVFYSGLLLVKGFAIGALVGFAYGVALGWSPRASYWGHPILRFVGPVPATAWLPFAFFAFPSSASAGVFLVALATGVPVAVLTWSGVASVNSAYYDIARTLGASERFLVGKVAIPAAMPHVFVGLFMGLAGAFAVLVVAEMMGVKAGLGWYLQWAQGWGAYSNMYAALAVLALLCSGAISLLFAVRDRLLAWQKGMLRW